MTEVRIPLAAVSMRASKPAYEFGNPTPFPVAASASWALVRAALPPFEDGRVVVDSAHILLTQGAAESGTVSVTLRPLAGKFTIHTTWNDAQAIGVTGTTNTLTKTNPAQGTVWDWDVRSDVQAFVDGTMTNFGHRVTSTATGDGIAFRGQTTPDRDDAPVLVLVYHVVPDAPDGLRPDGDPAWVSNGSPVLTWNADDDMDSFRVKIDAAADGASPDFASGTVGGSIGRYDLSAATGWTALGEGAQTMWQVQQHTAGGWSKWSSWAAFGRDDVPAVTILAPTSTTEDLTPVVEWTLTGTQTAFRVQVCRPSGRVLVDSKWVRSAATNWTADRLAVKDGDQLVVKVWVQDDNDDRVSVEGGRVYGYAETATTFNFDPTVDPMSTLMASQDGFSPVVYLKGTRLVGTPDEVLIYRQIDDEDEVLVGRYDGPSVFTGASFGFSDRFARMGHRVRYRVRPVVNGRASVGGPTATLNPARCKGIWLMEPFRGGKMAVLWGDEDAEFQKRGNLIVHWSATGDGPPVIRRLGRRPKSGTVTGVLVDVGHYTADVSRAVLEEFLGNDPATVYRLVLGDENREVMVTDGDADPTPLSNDTRVLASWFDWFATGRV